MRTLMKCDRKTSVVKRSLSSSQGFKDGYCGERTGEMLRAESRDLATREGYVYTESEMVALIPPVTRAE